MHEKLVIGLMSGTSVDGIDACLIKINSNFDFIVLGEKVFYFSPEFAQKIKNLFKRIIDIKELCEMNVLLGNYYAQAVKKLCKKVNIPVERIDLISSHGQTIFHNPSDEFYDEISLRSTFQIGELSVIAKKTGIKTVGDFRPCDIAANGQGAPLVTFFDEIFFKKDKVKRTIQNIGGIANLTLISPDCETFAFDTGPGNCLIDYFTQKYFNLPFDKNGLIAASGYKNYDLLFELMQNEYFNLVPPKSTGRELFSVEYAENIISKYEINPRDIITTLTCFTAKSIKDQYEKFVFPKTQINEIVLGGGGASNLTLKSFLQKEFGDIKIKTHEDYGISSKFKEAIAFAFLGYACVEGFFNNVPSATGATKKVIMGKIVNP